MTAFERKTVSGYLEFIKGRKINAKYLKGGSASTDVTSFIFRRWRSEELAPTTLLNYASQCKKYIEWT